MDCNRVIVIVMTHHWRKIKNPSRAPFWLWTNSQNVALNWTTNLYTRHHTILSVPYVLLNFKNPLSRHKDIFQIPLPSYLFSPLPLKILDCKSDINLVDVKKNIFTNKPMNKVLKNIVGISLETCNYWHPHKIVFEHTIQHIPNC